MWIVKLALDRPYTFLVLALLILIIGPLTCFSTPVDIFPNIDIPVVSIVWQYAGFSPSEMEHRIVTLTERSLTTTVNDIEHTESQSLNGVAVIKVFFHPGVKIDMAVAQITAISQTQLRTLPAGTVPPLVIQYNAASVPIIQLSTTSPTLNEQQLFDQSQINIRVPITTIQGAAIPYPYGGKQRQIQVDLNIPALQAHHLTPNDVVNALGNQNLILPSGTAKIGSLEYDIALEGSPGTMEDLNNLPVKYVDGSVIYIKDVAFVRDGSPPQTNIVRQDGQRSTLLSVVKNGNVSTLDIIGNIYKKLPEIKRSLPPGAEDIDIKALFDQSIFVKASINGVVREMLIAAGLTGLMILLFLGDWRSTVIIAVSIPLSILSSIIILSATGQTINIMTLSGLALAVGILVDDATVTIENIDNHLERGEPLHEAILNGASEIATPAFVSTLCICIVFIPMFLLTGVARYLFVPLAESVVFAVMASYVLSRTLVPTLAMYLLSEHKADDHGKPKAARGFFAPLIYIQLVFEAGFVRLRHLYGRILNMCLRHCYIFALLFLVGCGLSGLLFNELGQDFFPTVDAGQFKLHIRAKTGTRIEETAVLCDQVEAAIRKDIPPSEMEGILDNIGLPISGINLSYSNSGVIGPADADILVSLKANHRPTAEYKEKLRMDLPKAFPGTLFVFQPSDIVNQILNFGIPSPIDIQLKGALTSQNLLVAQRIADQLKHIPGAVDVRVQQVYDNPKFSLALDRSKSQQLGITGKDIASSLLVALSGSFQTSPTFWLDPKTGNTYNIAVQAPQYNITSLQDLENIPIRPSNGGSDQILANLTTISRNAEPGVINHFNVVPVIDVFADVQGTDLGSVSEKIQKIIADARESKDLPKSTFITLRGQVETMRQSFQGLGFGLIGAIVLVYLLLVVNFQSWVEPFIIITALPGALAGICWMLFLSGTTLSVPALMGAIMCIGVATANSILVISFAKERGHEGHDGYQSVLQAGIGRLRPVIMTAAAMIIGMVPMSLGLGEGGEQNAPLGRAVIGGLLVATFATLFFVPVVYRIIRGGRPPESISYPGEDEHESTHESDKQSEPAYTH